MDDSARELKRTFLLELRRGAEHELDAGAPPGFEVRRVELPVPELNWFFHQAVGAEFRWGGREDWDRARWREYVDRPTLETWLGVLRGAPAGYFELERLEDDSVRIHCFGLLRRFFGRGLGAPLLARAIERAWELDARRLWLTTCSHDHPHALPNYLARGFRIVSETTGPANEPRSSLLFGGEPRE